MRRSPTTFTGGSPPQPRFTAPRGRPGSSRSSAAGVDALVLSRARPGAFSHDLVDGSVWWSDVVAEAFGRPPGFAPKNAEHYLSMVHAHDRGAASQRIADAIESRSGFDAVEQVVWPDGSLATIRCKARVEMSSEGVPVALSGTTELLDLSPPASAQVHQRPRTDIAHDLRNVTQLLATRADMARMGVRDAWSPELVDDILGSLADLGHELMNPAGADAVTQEAVDLVAWVRQMQPRLVSAATTRRRVVAKLDAAMPLYARIDTNRLTHVLINLVSNARDATRRGDEIQVRLREEDGVVAVLEISDGGTGIAAEVLDRVFMRGYTTKGAGHGYGLVSARAAVSEMGGWIRIDSQKGVGTVVRVTLPLVRPDFDA